MANKECAKCIHKEVCKTAETCDGYAPWCKHFKEQKKGRWINDQVEGFSPFVDSLPIWIDVMQCSVCKEYIDGSHPKNYCPNCGADMRGEEDG